MKLYMSDLERMKELAGLKLLNEAKDPKVMLKKIEKDYMKAYEKWSDLYVEKMIYEFYIEYSRLKDENNLVIKEPEEYLKLKINKFFSMPGKSTIDQYLKRVNTSKIIKAVLK